MIRATNKQKYCRQPKTYKRKFDPGVTPQRKSFILGTSLKWVNGTVLTFMFMEGAGPQKNVVRRAFQTWKALGIGISFKEVANPKEAIIRIGFDLSDGSWSFVGRENLPIRKPKRTMNFGWSLTADSYGMTTAIHEIGHAIGFQHEHQSPFSGIVWNSEAVYTSFSGDPNFWSKAEIDSNIIDKLPPNQVQGSVWDPKSIMEYEFDSGLILQPAKYKNGIFPPGILSTNDIRGVKKFYPPITAKSIFELRPNKSAPITGKPGSQVDFLFSAPSTRKYIFQTTGELDTVMVISEKAKTELHYLAGDDDSGVDRNAKITLPLVKGRDYMVNIRIMYVAAGKSGSVIVT